MSLSNAQKRYREYFIEKIDTYGADPKGVDYKDLDAQRIRFEQLARVIDVSKNFSIIDYGSGYGALFDFLHNKGLQFEYYGFDMIEEMVTVGREAHKSFTNARFLQNKNDLPVADYLIAGSIFNNKFEANDEEWRAMILETLDHMNRMCTKGFSFDMLTKYSDADRIALRPDLYFADPLFMFDYCKLNFSRNVALLHDYGLYDFTILVRKDI